MYFFIELERYFLFGILLEYIFLAIIRQLYILILYNINILDISFGTHKVFQIF